MKLSYCVTVGVDDGVKVGGSRSNGFRDIRGSDFVSNDGFRDIRGSDFVSNERTNMTKPIPIVGLKIK